MAAETETTSSTPSTTPAATLQALVRSRLDEAQKGLQTLQEKRQQAMQTLEEKRTLAVQTLEEKRQLALQTLTARVEAARKELEGLLGRLESASLGGLNLKELAQRAEQLRTLATERLEALRAQVVEGSGLASQAQVQALQEELGRLAQKLEATLGTTGGSKKGAAKGNGEVRAS